MATPSSGGGGAGARMQGRARARREGWREHETGDPCPCPGPLGPPLGSRNERLRRGLQLKALGRGNSAAACDTDKTSHLNTFVGVRARGPDRKPSATVGHVPRDASWRVQAEETFRTVTV